MPHCMPRSLGKARGRALIILRLEYLCLGPSPEITAFLDVDRRRVLKFIVKVEAEESACWTVDAIRNTHSPCYALLLLPSVSLLSSCFTRLCITLTTAFASLRALCQLSAASYTLVTNKTLTGYLQCLCNDLVIFGLHFS